MRDRTFQSAAQDDRPTHFVGGKAVVVGQLQIGDGGVAGTASECARPHRVAHIDSLDPTHRA
ncbi:MAG TPA: hypothetical protein VFO07_09955 [Roseiflexaceae bacterium]|nr:hypothetical protein [Roseiflexaceae bacterium]